MKIFYYRFGVFFIVVFLFGSCSKEFTNQPKPNALPQTRLWLTPESDLHETISRQHFYWYGEDPDGRVVGYLLAVGNFKPSPKQLPSPDTMTYTWVTKGDTSIGLPLRAIRDSFTVIVRAVDNTFKSASLLPAGAVIKMLPQPYWDVDTNGVYDGNDIALSDLQPAADPKGAILLVPIRNTPPTVQFAANPVDSTIIQQPDTTFTVATFSWVGHDLDGDNTITGYRIALNDTSQPASWFTISGSPNFVTLSVPRSVSDQTTTDTVSANVYTGTYPNLQLRGTISGLRLDNTNVLYVQAHDIAGEYSKAALMPTTTARKWFVKKPKGRMLVVDDYIQSGKDTIPNFYGKIFSDPSIAGGSFVHFDLLDIGFGLTNTTKPTETVNQKYGSLVPQFLNPAFILTLKLYDVVFWYTDLYPSFTPAQIGLFYYTLGGGKAIFTTTFPKNISFPDVVALNDFAPIDSVSTDPESQTTQTDTLRTNAGNVLPGKTKILPSDATRGYDTLAFGLNAYYNLNWRRVYKRADAQYLYQLEPSTNSRDPYLGMPTVAVIDNAKTFVFFALPMHLLNGNMTGLKTFFRKVIVDEFGFQ
ncbi:MAG: hypothetical protein KGJ59_09625 [Bacteroidota bacterium]|nr:hypothetical protein [Bacteroidota bacterium]